MAMAGRIAAMVCCAPSTRGDFYAERGGAAGAAVVQSQQRWSGGCRALLIGGGTGRSRRGGPGLMVATARSSSGGRANKQREEKRSRESIPASPPQPPATSSGVREGDDGVEPEVVSEALEDDGEASAVVGSEPGTAELQAAEEDRGSSSRSSSRPDAGSADDIGKALSELRKAREALSSQDPATTTDFWKGVAEETRLIEWPVFSKVLGTTGVVVAMIVGSSVVLLTVNAILSASSDYAFNDPTFRDFAKTYLNLAF